MTLCATPAVSVLGNPVTANDEAAAAWTAMPVSLPSKPVRRVGRGDRLGAGGDERHGEGVRSRVGRGEGVGGGQDGLGVGAGEVDRAGVSGGHVAVRVMDGHGDVVRHARGVGRGETGDGERAGRGGLDRDARLARREARRGAVLGGDRLGAGGVERHGEGVRPRVGRGEGVAGGQDGLAVAAGRSTTVPVYPVATLPYGVVGGDGDVVRTRPRCRAVGKPETTSELAAAAWTVMPDSVPLMRRRGAVGRGDRLRCRPCRASPRRYASRRRPR